LLGGFPDFGAARLDGRTAAGDLGVVDGEVQAAARDVDLDDIAFLHEADQPAFGGLGGDMADR
jgi:hypothetical protein